MTSEYPIFNAEKETDGEVVEREAEKKQRGKNLPIITTFYVAIGCSVAVAIGGEMIGGLLNVIAIICFALGLVNLLIKSFKKEKDTKEIKLGWILVIIWLVVTPLVNILFYLPK